MQNYQTPSETMEIAVPAGSAIFAHIYDDISSLDDSLSKTFGMSVPSHLLPPELLYGVSVTDIDGVSYVPVRTKVRLEVLVRGYPGRLASEWLSSELKGLEVRNIPRDGLFKEHDLVLGLVNYSYSYQNTHAGHHEGHAIALRTLTVVPDEGDAS